MARAHEIFDPIAEHQCALPDIDLGRMFGTEGMRVRAKVYAFVVHNGSLVVKLSEERAGDLIASGTAGPMIMRGHPLREWVEVPMDAGAAVWAELIDEARVFVDAITP